MRHSRLFCAVVLTFSAAVGFATSADAAPQAEHLGKVDFPTSCKAEVQPVMDKGVALLHSFQYKESEETFTEAAKKDPKCAMALWGQAMALYHQLWDFPKPELLEQGHGYLEKALKITTTTPRERAYISAALAFFQDDPKASHSARAHAYSAAMKKVYREFPADPNSGAFYALSLLTLAPPGDRDIPDREEAIAVLDPLFRAYPNHPGAAHYLIHAADTPELAPQGLEAARQYAKIAPDSSHALHMPSHIFVRLGLWQESIDSNLAAAAAAAKDSEMHHADYHYQTHAMDFLGYSYLQSGQESKARALVDELKDVPGLKHMEEDVADQRSILEARTALELHRWKEAASLPVPAIRSLWLDTIYWAKAIGAARSGDVDAARKNTQKLAEVVADREADQKKHGEELAPGKAVDLSEAEAWLAYTEGKFDAAIEAIRGAAELEERNGYESLNLPAREMLADMLLELNKPTEALAEYKAVLRRAPNRFDALFGAASAAESLGNPAEARDFYAKLVSICVPMADRPELRQARTLIAK